MGRAATIGIEVLLGLLRQTVSRPPRTHSLTTHAPQVKKHWVHTEYWKLGPEGNDIQKTNVPALRMRFR